MDEKKNIENKDLHEVSGGYEKPAVESVKVDKGRAMAAEVCEHPHEGAKERCIEW